MKATYKATFRDKAMQQVPTFTQPCNPQSASRLIQLPAELRLKIMRMLHQNVGPLDSTAVLPTSTYDYSQHDSKDAERPLVELSAQTLACCQVLKKEASSILYEENTLAIQCPRPLSANCQYFNVLDVTMLIGSRLEELSADPETDHLESIINAWATVRTSWPALYRLQRFYKALKNI